MDNVSDNNDYIAFLAKIKERRYRLQYEAMKQVDATLIQLYWDIGRDIVEKQEVHKWAKSMVKNLSIDLQVEFTGMSRYLN